MTTAVFAGSSQVRSDDDHVAGLQPSQKCGAKGMDCPCKSSQPQAQITYMLHISGKRLHVYSPVRVKCTPRSWWLARICPTTAVRSLIVGSSSHARLDLEK